MVDQRNSRRSGTLATPVIGGLAVIGALAAGIAFRTQVWAAVEWVGDTVGTWLTEWVPAHRGQSAAIAGFAVVAFMINWIAHVRGRLRAWIFAVVVQAGLWALFWYGLGVPSLNELLGFGITEMPPATAAISGGLVIAITGALFWFLEVREEWRKYRRRHHVDDD
jgi:hypothetical protein